MRPGHARPLHALIAAALILPGCGYHVGGRAEVMPKTVRTIAIPAFVNVTARYKLARLLPADLTHEFLSRTRYQIVANPDEADAVLSGTLANFAAWPILSDPKTGRATAAEVAVNLNLTLTERKTGRALLTRNNVDFRERYEISLDPAAYFDESGTAVERVSRDVARSVVSAILEAF